MDEPKKTYFARKSEWARAQAKVAREAAGRVQNDPLRFSRSNGSIAGSYRSVDRLLDEAIKFDRIATQLEAKGQ